MTEAARQGTAFGEVGAAPHKRGDLDLIARLVPQGARVLDLGSGDGLLLERLRREKGVDGRGVERDTQAILACMRRGIPVVQANLDEGLADFPDHSFDVVIISHTLQQVNQPRGLLLEAGRVGDRVIVGFPNFGHWQVLVALALTGRMPKSRMLPYEWYDTPNIHLLTVADFEDFCAQEGFRIQKRLALRFPSWRPVRCMPGLRAAYALYLLDATGIRPSRQIAASATEPESMLVVEE